MRQKTRSLPSPLRSGPSLVARAGLMVTTALVLAHAASAASSPEAVPISRHDPVLFSADEVINDEQLDIVIARGHVEASQAGRTLLADVVSYNRKTDTVIATGNVSVIEEATGETVFASYIELNSDMKNGFIRDFRLLMADRSRLAANTGVRVDGTRTELRRTTYSACDLCADNPSAPPLWQLKGARVVRDLDAGVVRYHDATIEVDGFPVFWTPYFSHPDPSIKRASGFLAPTFIVNSVLGFALDTPYYWAIDVDKDLTFEPIFTAKQSSILGGEYRERFSDGNIDIHGSVTESNPDPGYGFVTTATNNSALRGHIFADGEFDLDDQFRTGFNIQRSSDPIYLQEYRYVSFATFLTSKLYLEDFDDRDYGSVIAYAFQPLQYGQVIGVQPVVLPTVSYQWAGRPQDWGGRFTTTLSAIELVRPLGISSRRVTAETEFDLPFTGLGGQQFNLVAGLRGDGYYVSTNSSSSPTPNGSTGRVFPQIGLEWRYPWVRRDPGSTWLIEPRAAVYAAPVGENPAKIVNNDSVAVDFNDQDLFSRNRSRGFDQVDGGDRVDYGLHASWHGDSDGTVDTLIGASYRFQHASPFALGTTGQLQEGTEEIVVASPTAYGAAGDGLQREASDYVGRVNYIPNQYFALSYRFRLDQQDLRPERQEAGITFGPTAVRFSVNYRQYGDNNRDLLLPRQQIDGGVTVLATDYWSFSAKGSQGLQGTNNLRSEQFNARYADDCTSVVFTIGQNNLRIGNYQSGATVLLQVVLKNLGEIASPSLAAGF